MEVSTQKRTEENVRNWYQQPYYISTDIKSRWLFSLGVGIFIFVFLTLFKPFGISAPYPDFLVFTGLFGIVSFVMVAIFHVGYRSWWLRHHEDKEWRAYHEIRLLLVMLICIGIANYIYVEQPWSRGWSLYAMFLHQGTTLMIGIFPTVFGVFLSQRRLMLKFRAASRDINDAREDTILLEHNPQIIQLQGSGESEVLSLDVNDLCYIKAADNYVLLYKDRSDGSLEKVILRATMKSIEEQLSDYPHILRSHKSYIINTQKVERVSGNAQGYKLHLRDIEDVIPVSRSLNKKVKEELMSIS